MKIKETKSLLSKGNLQKALIYISQNELINNDEVLMLNSKWTHVNNQMIKGIITQEVYNTEIAKLTQSILWSLEPDKIQTGKLLDKINELEKENLLLKEKIAFYKSKENNFSGYKFEDLFDRFKVVQLDKFVFINVYLSELGLKDREIKHIVKPNNKINYNNLLLCLRSHLSSGYNFKKYDTLKIFRQGVDIGLIRIDSKTDNDELIHLKFSDLGMKYLQRLIRKLEMKK